MPDHRILSFAELSKVSDFSQWPHRDRVTTAAMNRVDGNRRHGMGLPWSKEHGARPFFGKGSDSGKRSHSFYMYMYIALTILTRKWHSATHLPVPPPR